MDLAFSEWEFKLTGAVDLPLDFQASGQYTYLSGWYWTPYVRVRGLDYNAYTGRYINLTPRGSQQLPDRNLIDLRLAWSTKICARDQPDRVAGVLQLPEQGHGPQRQPTLGRLPARELRPVAAEQFVRTGDGDREPARAARRHPSGVLTHSLPPCNGGGREAAPLFNLGGTSHERHKP